MMADVGGVGPGSAVAPTGARKSDGADTPKTPAPAKPGRGSAHGPPTTWSKTPTQPGQKAQGVRAARIPAETAPRSFKAIEKTFGQLVAAEGKLAAAERDLAAARNSSNRSDGSSGNADAQIKKCNLAAAAAREELIKAQENFEDAIQAETNRPSRRCSFFPRRRASDERKVAERIDDAYAESGMYPYVHAANRKNQELRVTLMLSSVSEAMARRGRLSGAQQAEKLEIVADASNLVAEPRATDGSSVAEVKTKQLARLKDLLEDIVEENKHFDQTLFADVVKQCVMDMDCSKADLEKIRAILSKYGNVELNQWIDARLESLTILEKPIPKK